MSCNSEAIKAAPDTTITSVTKSDDPVSYCRVDGYVTTTNPGPNTVGFALAMPDEWNGRYFMLIPGGSGGTVPEPPARYLREGYAVATTDKGSHVTGVLDFSFQSDEARNADFMYRGPHVTAAATQALARAYYDRPQQHRYITGCSAGGAGTMMEAEWYPQDGEAFIAGAVDADGGPPDYWGYIAQTLYRDPERWISQDEMKRVADAIMTAFDSSDGAVDGLIWDPTKIKLRKDLFPFLSEKQFSTLELLNDGFPNAEGKAQGYWLSNPVPFVRMLLGTTPPPWTASTRPVLFMVSDTSARAKYGADYNILTDKDYTKPVVQPEVVPQPGTLGPGNLGPIQKTGGKIIMWIGAADHDVAPENEADYTDAATKLYGPKRVDWLRTFMAPGMYHCAGGEGQPTDVPDVMLRAAVAWVESGKAPDFVIASNPELERTYKLCSYPQTAIFKGGLKNPDKLDVNDAANWACTGTMSHSAP